MILYALQNAASVQNPQGLSRPADFDAGARVDRYIRAEMARERIPGVALGVYRNGETIKAEGYGLADVKRNIPVRSETIFESGSVAKQFTAVAIMMLVEEGKVDLDDNITKYFPDAPRTWSSIKVRNLLSHTSGLREYNIQNNRINLHKDYTPAQLLKIIESLPLDFQPGEKQGYRNTDYALLGFIIQQVTGKFWADFVDGRIFSPLGMSSTHVTGRTKNMANHSAGYQLMPSKLTKPDWSAPIFQSMADGNLNSTVLDLARWDAALYTERLLKESSLQQMWAIAKLNNGGPNHDGFGFGWIIGTTNGHRVIEHGGLGYGFKTHVARYLDDNLTVVVLTNLESAYSLPMKIAHVVAGMYEPSLARPELKIADEPQVTALVRNLIQKLYSGKPLDGWTQDEIRYFHWYLRQLSPMTSLELINREERDDRRYYTYRLKFNDFDCLFELRLDARDRIVGWTLPAD